MGFVSIHTRTINSDVYALSPAISPHNYPVSLVAMQYLHHKHFECNYGTSGPPLDKMFGTFRERMGKSLEYRGEAKIVTQMDTEETQANEYLSGGFTPADMLPTSAQIATYNVLYLSTFAMFLLVAVGKVQADAEILAFFLALGPVLFGLLVLALYGDQKSYLW